MSNVPPDDKPVQLPMVGEIDEQALAAESAFLDEATRKGLRARLGAYTKLSGPGWLQGAMTLGGGSAASSLLAGTIGGYRFLWVQPLAMITGIVMLMAIGHLTLSSRTRPFDGVSRFAHPLLAWLWALASLAASIVWCFPQFSLAESVFRDIAGQLDFQTGPAFTWTVSGLILILTLTITLNYGKNQKWIKYYELLLKLMVAVIILSFLAVVIVVDVDWAAALKGFLPLPENLPHTPDEIGVVISAFATAVGINMTFLLPYSMLAKGWGKSHRGLAKFDLWTGLLIPYMVATGLIIIATAVTLHGHFDFESQKRPGAVHLAVALEPLFGGKASHYVFGCGIIGMAVSTITLLMLVSGFIVSALFESKSRTPFVIGALLPSLGALAPVYWGKLEFYMAVPTSNICYFMMPIAYMSFIICMNRKGLLGKETPTGGNRLAWNTAMFAVLAIVTYGGFYKIHYGIAQNYEWGAAFSVLYVIGMLAFFAWGIYLYLNPREDAV